MDTNPSLTNASPVPPSPLHRLAHNVFVGREREMNTLRASLEETLAGQGRAVMLLGEPGIGKTRLATEFISYAQTREMRVLIGLCPDSDGAPPYWPWVQIVRTYIQDCDEQLLRTAMGAGAAALAHVIPALRERFPNLAPSPRLEAEQERFHLFDSLTTFLKNIATHQPLLLVLDDLQWADVPSLLFLQFLVRELTDTTLLLVLTCRENEAVQQPQVSQTLAAIARTFGSQTISLCGLTDGEVARFIALTTGQTPSTEISTAVFQRTEGHPFFMTEVVRLLASEQTAATSGTIQTSLPVLPPTVRSVIEQRLATVSSECRQTLVGAAVIGKEFDLRLLSSVRMPSPLPFLDEALAAHLIAPAPQTVGRYRFAHALIQETLYESVATTERLRLHHQIGEALEGIAGASVTSFLPELAHHFFQAALSGSVEKAITYAIRAAEGATAVLAYEEAIAYYERALQLLSFKEPDEALHCDLLLALGKAQQRASDFTAATQHFQQAADLARTHQFSHQLAHAALEVAGTRIPITGATPAILQLLHEALALLPKDAYGLRAQLLARLAKELTYSESHEEREQYSYEAVRLARLTADPYAIAAALCDHCTATWRPDSLEERLTLSAEILALGEQVNDPDMILYGHFLRIAHALEHDDLLTIDAELAGFARRLAEIRPPLYTWMWLHERLQTMRAMLTGRFAEAENLLLYPSASLSHTPNRAEAEAQVFPQFMVLRREQGRLQEPALEMMLKQGIVQYPALSTLRCALAYTHAELAREAEARVEYEQWATHNFTTVPRRQDRLMAFAYMVEMCTMWGDVPRAKQLYALLLPYAERNVIVAMTLGYFDTVAHLLGKLAAILGQYEDAQTHFEFALQRNLRLSARPRLAYTQYSYACMLLTRNHSGDQEQAVKLLEQALATAQELEMPGLAGKIQGLGARGWELGEDGNSRTADNSGLRTPNISSPTPNPQPLPPNVFRRDGEYWTVNFQNVECHLKDSRGLHYLAQLLLHPHHEFSALDLVNLGVASPEASRPQRAANELAATASVTTGGDAGELLDPQAKAAYQQRIKEIREELEEAREFNDPGRIEKLEEEQKALLQELRRAVGLGGRRRKAGSASERARLNVTVTLKSTIARITKQHRALGQHLTQTIKTGTFCSYAPNPAVAVQWQEE